MQRGPGDVAADRQRAPRAELGEEGCARPRRRGASRRRRRRPAARRSPRRRRGPRRRRSPARRPARTRSAARRSAIRSVSPSTCSAATAITIAPSSGTFAEAGGDVAAQLDEVQVGPDRGQLGPPAHGARGHGRARRQVGRAVRPISASAASRRRRKAPIAQRVVGDRREVLGRVHGDVGPAVEHGLLDLLDEDALAADGVQRDVLAAVTGRLDEHQLDVAPGRPPELVGHAPGPASGPAGCRGWPGARGSTRRLSGGRTGRSPRRRCARPAACRRRGAGARTGRAGAWRRSCGSAPRPPRARCRRGRPGGRRSGPARWLRTCSARSCSWATSGAAWRAVTSTLKRSTSSATIARTSSASADAQGEAAVGPVAQVVEVEQRDAGEPADRCGRRSGARRCRRSAAGAPGGGCRSTSSRVTTLCPDAVQATTTSHVRQRPRRRGRGRGPGRRRARPGGRRAAGVRLHTVISAAPAWCSAVATPTPISPAPTTSTLRPASEPEAVGDHLDGGVADRRRAAADGRLACGPACRRAGRGGTAGRASSARRRWPRATCHAARTWPRISLSPSTAESSPAATSKRCRAAASSCWL